MNVTLVTYLAKQNGLSLFVVPETQVERVLLQGLWKHGTLEKCNGIGVTAHKLLREWNT